MEFLYDFIHGLFQAVPEIAFFLSLGLGYWVGKIQFGRFQLGGVAGSLIMAVCVSQFGVHIDDGVKNVLFALFIYAVGFTCGPNFFRSLGRHSIKEIVLAVVLAVTGLGTVVLMARFFGLDKGLAAGIAAGGLTQSAIMGTAESAIKTIPHLDANQIAQMVANISVGYGVTYIFGSFGAIFICTNILERFMGRSIRDDAVKAEATLYANEPLLDEGQQFAVPNLVGRLFLVGPGAGQTVAGFEQASGTPALTVERLKRKGKVLTVSPQLVLEAEDTILVVGQRSILLDAAQKLGGECADDPDMELRIQTREVVVTNKAVCGKTVREVYRAAGSEMRHGLYLLSLSRAGVPVPVTPETVVEEGDIATLYGTEQDVRRVAAGVGYALVPSDKTDFVYMGFGLVFGLIIGHFVLHMGPVPITLGSGGGALLSGLLFGWFRSKHMQIGSFPGGAAQLLKDFGLAGFVVVVGLNYGMLAITTIKNQGISIFLVGAVVTIVPLVLTMLVGKYVLRYDNSAIFAGALAGTRSANPAFGEVLNKAGNSVPTTPFAITYGLANVFLTLLGPLVVALV